MVITSVLLFKSISYYVICQICFCIRKHLRMLISFFLLKIAEFAIILELNGYSGCMEIG